MILNSQDKIEIEELYLKGIEIKEISKRLDKSYDAVKKFIQRNLKHLKEKHEREKLRVKEILKVTKWESSKAISNHGFAKCNQSIYRQAKNGDLVVNKEVAPVITFDTPKRITKVM
ncbi:DNA-binding response regulator [uncultured Clostridium sp.]|uniref:DNA-binding response regulator n=1 Tax=uncultured Clostridium sp. TaxID=59620 RepID=UPI00272EFAE4|nr:DNA-binding response regulator [uncultured Clostridium sp.]